MMNKLKSKDRVWVWFSVGAVASFVGSALVRTALTIALKKEQELKLDDTQSSDKSRKYFFENQSVDDLGEEPCRDNGTTLVNHLRVTDWNLNTSNTLEELDMSYMSNNQIIRLAGELWFALKKNILSLETAYERWVNENCVLDMLRRILLVYKDALKALERWATTLEINLAKQGLSGAAQSWPNCICFLANYGTCVEIVAALALTFPIGQQVWGRLRDELKKSQYHLYRDQFELFDKLAKPIKNYDEIAIKALNEGLKFEDTSMSRIENSAKVLQDSVELFWKCIVVKEGEKDSEALPSFDLKTLLTTKTEIHSSLLSDIDLSSDSEPPRIDSVVRKIHVSPAKQFMRHNSLDYLKHPVRKKYQQQNRIVTRNRSNTAPQETNRIRYARMNSTEQMSELNEMRCVMQRLVGDFNKMQEECSSADESSSSYAAVGNNFLNENSDGSELGEMAAMHRQLTHLQLLERNYCEQVEMGESTSTLESKVSKEKLLATI